MATIITRETGTTAVNRALTNTELDNNFINLNTDIGTRILSSEKAAVNGVATLDATGKVPATQLPSYVDDVQEAANLAAFPATGETGKIYVALDTNKAYRWSGSVYVYITSGAVDSVAGRTGVVVLTKSDVGLANADNTADSSKNVLSATKWTTARTISITGDLSGSVSVDGTANASITGTLPATGVSAGSYGSATAIPVFTVDAKGRITAASTSAITVGNGALSLSISTGSTNTAVSVGTGTGFTANSSSAASYTMTVGPALVNLATLMTTAGAGFIRRGATADTYTIDTNTYLTAEADTLATVTARGASTSTSVTLSGTGNQFGGHFYFLPYDAAGNHYPHFNDGGSASGSKINWRLYTGVNNTVTHTWTTSLATFATNIAASNFSGSSSGTNTGDNPGVTAVAGVTPIVSSGGTTPSISHATSGVGAGTYNNVTVNTFGHVTAGSNVAYYHSGNVPPYPAEVDTLATVTARGASTSTASTFSGGLTGRAGTTVAAITGIVASNSAFMAAETQTGAGGFVPAFGQSTVVTGGYRSHMVLGSYRTGGSNWNGGPILTWGGADANSTEYWLFNNGGAITHSSGRNQVDTTNISSYAVTSIAATSPIVTSAATGAITLSHATSGVTAGTYNNVTVNATGHVTAGSNTAYLTGESDTLATVTGRGASTSTNVSLNGGISSYMGDSGVLFQSYNASASNAAQFNISHSLGAVTISNARGALTLNGNVSGSSGSTTGSATSLYSPNAATVVAADSAMPAQGNSLIHTLALGPSGNDGHIIGMTWANTSTIYGAQIWLDTDPTNAMAIRGRSSTGVWTAWTPVLTSGNYNSYSPTLTGTGASGTWGISITGGAATATTAGSVTGLTLTSSANGINPDNVTENQIGYNTSVSLFGQTDGGLYSSAYSSSWIHQIYGDFRTGQIAIRGKNSGTWQAWRTVVDSSNVSSYAVSSISATSPIVASASTGAITLSHANSGVTAGTYNNVTVNNKGHVTAGSNAAYLTAEADTLATVTGRGASTTTPVTLQRIFWNTDGGNSNNTFAANHYSIGQAAGAWTHPYPDLIIGHHTGIRIGAHYNYGGTRFYNNSPWGGDTGGGETELMSIGNGDDHVRIAQIGYAGNSFRAPVFYDSNDTSYYVDPASTSDTAQRMRGGTVYGPNVTWGAYLLVGGDGRQNYTNTAYASVCTTNGNLHLDSGTAAATHINWYDGTDLLVGAGDSGTLRFKVYGVDNYSYATGSMRSPIFYDSDDTAYYGDFAGTSRANLIKANSVYDWSTTRGIIPNGASYTTSAGAVTGAFKIKLPDGSRLLYPMLSFTVQLYNYSTGTSRSFRIGGHFSGASWHNIFAYCLTDYAGSLDVRFGYDAANAMCVWIGETGTTWSYPQVFVTDFQNGYSAIQESWFTGWSITLVTAFDTVSNGPYTPAMGLNSKNYNSYAPTLTGTGASGTWGISISGNAATSTTSANTNAVNITSTGGTTFYLLGTHTNSAGARSVVYGVPYYNSATGRLNVPNGIVLDAGNYNNYSPSLTGNGASGTWGISISGTAANATNVPWTGITSRPADVMYYEGFTLDANTMSRNSTGFSYSVNAPWTGPIARFSAGGSYDLWLNAPYSGGGNQLSFRTRNGDTATYNAWKAVLHDGNYNSYSPTLTGTGASGTWGINVTGTSNNITAYTINQSVGTGNQPTFADVYMNGWFRTNASGNGMYNQSTGQHFYSDSANYWNMGGGNLNGQGIRFRDTHAGTVRGYVYYDQSNNIGFLNQDGSWRLRVVAGDYSLADGSSMRAQLYYDSNDTTYYLDAAGNSEFNRINTVRTNNFLYMDNNYGHSIVGAYSASRYQGVFAMGDSYKLPADGTTTGSLYGLAWSHPNAGGVAANLNTHGLLAMENGTWLASLCGSTRARDDMRAPIFYDNNNTAFYLDPNTTGTSLNVAGSITAGGNITASSDIRLKEDIEVITDAINKVKQITGVTYTRKENNKRQTGVIAQDVLKVLPEAVEGSEDSMYSVAYGNMVGLLIEAIKDQQTIIDSQESRITKLEILVAQLIEG